MSLFAFGVFFVCFLISLSNQELCKKFEEELKHEFHPLRHCQRSKKSVVAVSNVDSLEDCVELAKMNRGLALNFSPAKARSLLNLFDKSSIVNRTTEEEDFYNCEVLECPEYRNLSSIVNDTRYDYYSLFANPPRK